MSAAYDDSIETRQAIIDACRAMEASGLNRGTSGNVSVRAGDAMLITPSGVPVAAMSPDQIVRLPLDGGAPMGRMKPSSEWPFHSALLRARSDIHAVVHAHPPHATAQAMTRAPIPACHYMVAAFGGTDVRVADYALFGSEALSDAVVAAMQDRHACLMANHGATAVGGSLELALWRMEELEMLAQQYILAKQAGGAVILSEEEVAVVAEKFKGYGPGREA